MVSICAMIPQLKGSSKRRATAFDGAPKTQTRAQQVVAGSTTTSGAFEPPEIRVRLTLAT